MATNASLRVAVFGSATLCLEYAPAPQQTAAPGCRVRVPLNKSARVGMVLEVLDEASIDAGKLLPVSEALDDEPIVPDHLLSLLRWMADYYHYSFNGVLCVALPDAIRRGKPLEAERTVWECCPDADAAIPARAKKQKALYELLASDGPLDEQTISSHFGGWQKPLQALAAKGAARCRKAERADEKTPQEIGHDLNAEQAAAVAAVRGAADRFGCYLLEGVTGSGKTEVYLNLCADAIASQRQALALVPEIGLIPQTISRFRKRLGGGVMSFHSALTPSARAQCWSAVSLGRVSVVVGTRSAIFLPFQNLGLIIVDEEHDASYKQDAFGGQRERLCYHARDVAVKRARDANIPVVLGSATASLESLRNAADGKYRRLSLPRRVGQFAQPAYRIIDMRAQQSLAGMSEALVNAMREKLAADEQVLLFINRRGYAPVTLCEACGEVLDCERCDTHMTYHLHDKKLRCHQCGKATPVPPKCPACGASRLRPAGVAIEQIEEALRALFPAVGIVRFDSDAVRRKDQLEELFDRVHKRRARILLGTQMLIKGHHFTGVTLVGVINVDNSLFSSDFRAVERLAQVVIQVGGRAGRGEAPGEVMIQTHHPEHPHLRSLLQDGYAVFAKRLLAERASTELPPYYRCAVFRAEAVRIEEAMKFLSQVARLAARTQGSEAVRLYAPMPATMEKRQGLYRARLVVKARQGAALQRFLTALLPRIKPPPSGAPARWHIDVDPIEFD